MTEFLRMLNGADVVDSKSFARYAQQRLGTPVPSSRVDFATLQRSVRICFEQNPAANWLTLVGLVDWAKACRKRPATVPSLLRLLRFAWQAGMLPELDPDPVQVDTRLEQAIDSALERETDEWWQRRLIGAVGLENRREALEAWRRKEQRTREEADAGL